MLSIDDGRDRGRPRSLSGPLCALIGTVLLSLQGCAGVVPQASSSLPFGIPAGWSAAATTAAPAESLARWWLRFDDPLLARLVTQALQANTGIVGAQAALREARALRDVAAAALWPAVGASASAQHGTAGHRSTGNAFAAGLDASWELDLFGANRSALAAAEATAQASADTLGAVQVSLAAETGLAYITLRGLQARLAIAETNLASQQETLQITQWRRQAGLVSELEAEQARASTEQTRALVPALRTGIAASVHALSVLTGQPPAALAPALSAVRPVPLAPADVGMTIPAATLRQRPDVQAAEHQVVAAAARVAQADAARAPNISVGGKLGLAALTLGALSNGASIVTALLASITMPVFDGGAGLAQVHAQEGALDQARATYAATVLVALTEVEDALAALEGDSERRLRLQFAADAAANAALMARQRYSSGLIDFQTVLETQRTQLVTQDSVAGADADVSADHVRLYKALGGGWTAVGTGDTALPSAAAAAEPTWTPLP